MNNYSNRQGPFLCNFVETYFFDYDTNHNHKNVFILLVFVNGLFAITTTFSNLVVIISVIKNPACRCPSNIFIVGLTLSDLGVGIIAQPLFCVLKVLELHHQDNNTIICHVSVSFNTIVWLLGTVSFLTLTCITADRFMALHLHLRYQSVVSTKKYTLLVITIWVFCTSAVVIKRLLRHYNILQGLSIAMCALGFILNGIFIYKIAKVVGWHTAQMQVHEQPSPSMDINMPRYKRTVNTLYYIIGAFTVCYLPIVVTIVIHTSVQRRVFAVYWGYFIAGTLAMINSSLNPVIYCWKNKEIRNAVFQLFRRASVEN